MSEFSELIICASNFDRVFEIKGLSPISTADRYRRAAVSISQPTFCSICARTTTSNKQMSKCNENIQVRLRKPSQPPQ